MGVGVGEAGVVILLVNMCLLAQNKKAVQNTQDLWEAEEQQRPAHTVPGPGQASICHLRARNISFSVCVTYAAPCALTSCMKVNIHRQDQPLRTALQGITRSCMCECMSGQH